MEKPFIPYTILLILGGSSLFYTIIKLPPSPTTIPLFILFFTVTLFSTIFIIFYKYQRKKLQAPKIAYRNSFTKAFLGSILFLSLIVFRLTGNFEPLPIILLLIFIFLLNRILSS